VFYMPEETNNFPIDSEPSRSLGDPPSPVVTETDVSPPRGNPFPVVGIGASAGGLEAFTQLLESLPGDTGMAFVLIQHLDPSHVSHLPEILAPATPMPVVSVEDGLELRPNHVYVIPPNATIALVDGSFRLVAREPGLHLPIDIFFRSLAHVQGGRAIGVVLSGSASDGSAGLKAIKAECGLTFAQDESSAKYGSMPRAAAATGAVDFILSPAEIARELAHLGRHPYVMPAEPVSDEVLPDGDAELKRVFALLEAASKVDFSHYKLNTVRRRIGRRMIVNRSPDLASYAHLLEENSDEVTKLYRDLLISVTSFFRNPASFYALKRILEQRLVAADGLETFRVWVPGCATGEEVYSLAITIHELLQDMQLQIPVQLFGTDISEVALARARAAVYSEIVSHDVPPEKLRRYFVKRDGSYQIIKDIREACVFARQDVTKDPPFSQMDLVSCRNVLIYLSTALQQRVLPIFHYSMKPTGLLMLGTAESVAAVPDLFTVVDKQHKLFARKEAPLRLTLDLRSRGPAAGIPATSPVAASHSASDVQRRVDRLIQSRYAPDAVVVDSDLKIIQFRGRTKLYLDPSPGEATLHILRMARESLVQPLRRGLQMAKEQNVTVRETGVAIDENDKRFVVNIEIAPVPPYSSDDRYFVVVFTQPSVSAPPVPSAPAPSPDAEEPDNEVRRLERELAELREYTRNLAEDHEAHSEELRAANEEIRSGNEELQSTNEELGTAKEELQSANEELTTVNEELQTRNNELTAINSDFKNLLTAVNIPIVMVDGNLRVRRFTAAAEKLMELTSADIGRPVRHLRGQIQIPDLEAATRFVIESLNVWQRELQDENGRWLSVSIRPYRTIDDRIDGAVITLVDISPLKQSILLAEKARDYAEAMIDTVRQPLVVLDTDMRVQRVTGAFCETFQVSREETVGRQLFDLGNGQWNKPRLRELLGNALFRDTPFQDFEVEHDFPHLGRRTMRLNARRIPKHQTDSKVVLLSIEDVTERLERAEIQYRRIFETAKDGILTFDAETGAITDVNQHMLDMMGYSREEVTGRKLNQIRAFEESGEDVRRLVENARTTDMLRCSVVIRSRSGSAIDVELIANPYTVGGQKNIQANVRDVTSRKRTEAALREAEERFRLFVDSVRDYALFQMDTARRIITWNSGAERLLGYNVDEILGQSGNIVFTPEDITGGAADREFQEALRTGRAEDERWHMRKDGSRFFASGVLTLVHDDSGRHVGFAKVMRDVTARKEAEEELRGSVREKEVLLREIHHRVKNNLQVISSLLTLQSDHLADSQASAAFAEMRSRVLAMASVHELLYNSADLSQIDLGSYLTRLSSTLLSIEDRISLVAHAPSVKLELNQAIPAALLVNELITNSIKHAFPGGRKGAVKVTFAKRGDVFRLEVSDNGVGIPAAVNPFERKTMGLQLVQLLVEQLQGTVEIERKKGTRFIIEFPRLSPKESDAEV
jgi:two-component system, chemotaxis family, CheB/CheR fusion protein